MGLKEGKWYRSVVSGVIYRVIKIDTYTRNAELYSRNLVFHLYLDLDYANKILKPLPKLKEILFEEYYESI